MRFGMFDILRWHEDWTAERAFDASLEQIEFADKLGIQDIWLGEHHFSRHGILSGIFSFLGAVAAKTENARIGTAIVVLPFHNPVLVAEESAIIDIISNGRFNLGVGAGYQAQEFHGLGVDIAHSREMFNEYLDVIQQCWADEGKTTFKGKFVDFQDIWVIPKPGAEAGPAHLHRRQHQPGERGQRSQARLAHHRWRTDDYAGADAAGRQSVA